MIAEHSPDLEFYKISKELLTEWKNIKKQRCMVLVKSSRDPEELTPDATMRHYLLLLKQK